MHLYDSFEKKISYGDKNIEDIPIENFEKEGLKMPAIHKGLFNETLPAQLPDQIAFAHIDCGFGGDKFQYKEIVLFCLENIYTKMLKGAVCVLTDYFDPSTNNPGIDCNPGVKLACDDFLKINLKLLFAYTTIRYHMLTLKSYNAVILYTASHNIHAPYGCCRTESGHPAYHFS
ncbi:MAG: hypothetical protein QM594_12470 [Niabella sp.]